MSKYPYGLRTQVYQLGDEEEYYVRYDYNWGFMDTILGWSDILIEGPFYSLDSAKKWAKDWYNRNYQSEKFQEESKKRNKGKKKKVVFELP